MNSQQLKYAKERLESIYNTKVSALGSQYTWGLTEDERERAFADGKFAVEKQNNSYIVVFIGDKEKREVKREQAALLKKEYNRIMDELMLGDEEEALNLINSFRDN